MGIDDLQDLSGRTSIVDRDGEIELDSELAELVQPRDLDVAWWSACLFEIDADLADGHHPRIAGQIAEDIDVRRRCFCGVMTNSCPHLPVTSRERNRHATAVGVDPHRDHAGHAGFDRRADNCRGVTQLLQMEVGVYEDATTSSV
jgi:hypothetical protein